MKVGEQRAGCQYGDRQRAQQARQRVADERAQYAVIDAGDNRDDGHHRDAAHPVAQARERRAADEKDEQLHEQQRLEKRGRVHEALERGPHRGRRIQRAGECQAVHGHQHSCHDGKIAEVGQNVRIGVLPYTGHGYEQVLNRIQSSLCEHGEQAATLVWPLQGAGRRARKALQRLG
jgi:hypothetical protein